MTEGNLVITFSLSNEMLWERRDTVTSLLLCYRHCNLLPISWKHIYNASTILYSTVPCDSISQSASSHILDKKVLE